MSKNKYSAEINLITRQSIMQAMSELLKSHRFSSITITLLCNKAGVSRNAFYRNYADTQEIIRDYLSEQWATYYEDNKHAYCLPDDLGQLFCAYIYDDRSFIAVLDENNLMHTIEDTLYQALGPSDNAQGAELYLKSCTAYMVYGFVMAMVRSKFVHKPEEIAKMLQMAAGTVLKQE